jgi:hypothetical protein
MAHMREVRMIPFPGRRLRFPVSDQLGIRVGVLGDLGRIERVLREWRRCLCRTRGRREEVVPCDLFEFCTDHLYRASAFCPERKEGNIPRKSRRRSPVLPNHQTTPPSDSAPTACLPIPLHPLRLLVPGAMPRTSAATRIARPSGSIGFQRCARC